MADRKAFTRIVVKGIAEVIPGSDYIKVIEKMLNDLTDDEFEQYVSYLERTGDSVPIVVPNMSDTKIDVIRNIKICRDFGYEPYQPLILTDPVSGMTYKTPVKYLILTLPFRRQQQLLEEKTSIPDSNRQVNDLTGQPTGASKGASITYPEVQVMRSQEWIYSLEEFLKYRGGDTKGFQLMNRGVAEQGGVSLHELSNTPTRVKSTDTVYTYLMSAHLDNNVNQ